MSDNISNRHNLGEADGMVRGAPKVPIKTALSDVIDSEEKEAKFMRYVKSRYDAAATSCQSGGWAGTREWAEASYRNDFSERVDKGVFRHCNFSFNLPRRFIRDTKAQAFNDLLSVYPMLNVRIEGGDEAIAAAAVVQRYVTYFLDQADIVNKFREGIENALGRGENIVKTGWKTQMRRWKKMANVLIGEDGEPVLDSEGQPILETDARATVFLDTESTEGAENAQRMEKDGEAASQNPSVPSSVSSVSIPVTVLQRDPSVVIPEDAVFEPRLVELKKKAFEGLVIENVYWKDFVCNTSKASLKDSDFIAHRYDWPLGDIEMILQESDQLPATGDQEAGTGRDALPEVEGFIERHPTSLYSPEAREFIRNARMGCGTPSAANQSIYGKGEESMDGDYNPMVNLVECHVRMSVAGDGIIDNIVVVYDVTNDQPLYYDYLENVSPTFDRPFQILRILPVAARWYGMGYYEYFKDRHDLADLFINRINFRNSTAGQKRFIKQNAILELQGGGSIDYTRPDEWLTVAEGHEIDDVIKVFETPCDVEGTYRMLEMLLQTVQAESGTLNMGSQKGSDALPSAKLATGIKAMEKTAGNLITELFADLNSGIEAVLTDAVHCTLVNFDRNHARMLLGEEAAQILEGMRDITALPFSTFISRSNTRDEDKLSRYSKALDTMEYWERLSPEAKERYRKLFLDMLKSLQVDDVEEMLKEQPPVPPKGQQDAGNAMSDATAENGQQAPDAL